jgi:hypothetical protein
MAAVCTWRCTVAMRPLRGPRKLQLARMLRFIDVVACRCSGCYVALDA